MSLLKRLTAVVALSSVALVPIRAQGQRSDTMSLHRTLDSLAHHFHGVLGYSINNLDTGERLTLRGHETFPTYFDPNVQRVIANGVRWVGPQARVEPREFLNVRTEPFESIEGAREPAS